VVKTAHSPQRKLDFPEEVSPSSDFFHCAWGGRLCLHPFNLGFRLALSREAKSQI